MKHFIPIREILTNVLIIETSASQESLHRPLTEGRKQAEKDLLSSCSKSAWSRFPGLWHLNTYFNSAQTRQTKAHKSKRGWGHVLTLMLVQSATCRKTATADQREHLPPPSGHTPEFIARKDIMQHSLWPPYWSAHEFEPAACWLLSLRFLLAPPLRPARVELSWTWLCWSSLAPPGGHTQEQQLQLKLLCVGTGYSVTCVYYLLSSCKYIWYW